MLPSELDECQELQNVTQLPLDVNGMNVAPVSNVTDLVVMID